MNELVPHMLCACLWQLLDADNLLEIEDASKQPTLLAVAAHFPARDRGEVRLIDNMVLCVEVA